VILDYDYTFTTPYCGSETIEIDTEEVCALSFSITVCNVFQIKIFASLCIVWAPFLFFCFFFG
jgi:hypothetical protein